MPQYCSTFNVLYRKCTLLQRVLLMLLSMFLFSFQFSQKKLILFIYLNISNIKTIKSEVGGVCALGPSRLWNHHWFRFSSVKVNHLQGAIFFFLVIGVLHVLCTCLLKHWTSFNCSHGAEEPISLSLSLPPPIHPKPVKSSRFSVPPRSLI